MDRRKLYKSNTDKAIFGVCGGIAEYMGVDSLVIRLAMVLMILAFGSGLLFYIIAALIIPARPAEGFEQAEARPGCYNAGGAIYVNRASQAAAEAASYADTGASGYQASEQASQSGGAQDDADGAASAPREQQAQPGAKYYADNGSGSNSAGKTRVLIGALLIAAGVISVLRVVAPWVDYRMVFGVCAILAGVFMIAGKN